MSTWSSRTSRTQTCNLMASDVTNRKTPRKALAALLEAALVGIGKPAQALYDYKASDFDGQTPVIVVSSGPAERAKQAQTTRVSSFVDVDIDVFTMYAEEGWSEEDSEDKQDDLEKAISDVLMDNDSTDDWAQLSFNGASELDFTAVGGKMYRRETIPVRIQLYTD